MVYVLCFLFYWYCGKVTFERSNAELKIKNENICKYTVLVRIIGTLVKHEQKQGCKKWSIVYFVCQKALFLVSSDHRSRSCVKYRYSVWQLNILSFFLNERRGFSLELAVMRCCLMFFEAHIISAVVQLCLWSLESLWPLELSSLGRCQHTVRPLPSRFVTSQVNWNILIISLVV